MNPRRQRVAWLVALGLVTALASAPTILSAVGGEPTRAEVVVDSTGTGIAPLSGRIAGFLAAAPQTVREFFTGLVR
jgi:hypothetical protein